MSNHEEENSFDKFDESASSIAESIEGFASDKTVKVGVHGAALGVGG